MQGIDHTTDVLSASRIVTSYLVRIFIIWVISQFPILPTAVRQALAAGHSVESEISLLAIHGVLHLLGYDHSTDVEKKVMWSMQRKCLLELGIEIKIITGDGNDA